jgi:hypothetical protein
LLRKHFGHAEMNFAHFLGCPSSALIGVTEIGAAYILSPRAIRNIYLVSA